MGFAVYLLNKSAVLMQNKKKAQSNPQRTNNADGSIRQSFCAKGIL